MLILAIGAWWSYLLLKIDETKQFSSMILWEGGTFLLLLLLISGTLFFLYIKNLKKNKALQAFFSSLTHELKTPLASIRLQADAIESYIETLNYKLCRTLAQRMIEDTQNLEIQMDKIIQLSRIEQGGILNPVEVDLKQFLKSCVQEMGRGLQINLNLDQSSHLIFADKFALELILKNLFENTKRHSPKKKIDIFLKKAVNTTTLIYNDRGVFTGERKRLGTLFYKHNSSSGSGIGLYLAKKLMEKMGGKLNFVFQPNLHFELHFKPKGVK
jgi:signal transduction histidine kinase